VPRSRKFANPFYALLLVAGITFALTATAYGVMAFREARPAHPEAALEEEHPLMLWLRHHGNAALLTELAVLALVTFAAIGTDDYWQRRNRQNMPNKQTANQR
jgi:hypothetical protein